MFISGWIATWNNAQSWRIYSADPMANQAAGTMTHQSQAVPLSGHWANQSIPYPNNVERQARKRKVSSLIWQGSKLLTSCTWCTRSTDWATMPDVAGLDNSITLFVSQTIAHTISIKRYCNSLNRPTRRDGRMSKASTSRFGRSWNLKLGALNPGRDKWTTLKLILGAS